MIQTLIWEIVNDEDA